MEQQFGGCVAVSRCHTQRHAARWRTCNCHFLSAPPFAHLFFFFFFACAQHLNAILSTDHQHRSLRFLWR
ncbi:MAG: hypothetical protein Q8P67_19955 [archaeon]|nr:hypothetical protein [archaeon]